MSLRLIASTWSTYIPGILCKGNNGTVTPR